MAFMGMFGPQHGAGSGGIDWNGIYKRFASERPTGYFTPEDQAFIDRQAGRAGSALSARTGDLRAEALNRLTARGIKGPAAERALGRIRDSELLASSDIGSAALDTAYKIRSGREDQQWGLIQSGMNNAFNAANLNMQRRDKMNSAFWSSMQKLVPAAIDMFAPGGGTALAKVGGGSSSSVPGLATQSTKLPLEALPL